MQKRPAPKCTVRCMWLSYSSHVSLLFEHSQAGIQVFGCVAMLHLFTSRRDHIVSSLLEALLPRSDVLTALRVAVRSLYCELIALQCLLEGQEDVRKHQRWIETTHALPRSLWAAETLSTTRNFFFVQKICSQKLISESAHQQGVDTNIRATAHEIISRYS